MDPTPRKKQKLSKATKRSVDRFSLSGIEVQAKVVKVHDGDTCDLAFYFVGKIRRFKCRLAGIDATELDEEDDQDRDGEIGRDFLAWLSIGNKPDEFPDEDEAWTKKELQEELDKSGSLVHAILGEYDKYGRVLVRIKASKSDQKSFNQLLVDYRYAKVLKV